MKAEPTKKLRLGDLLVQEGLITQEQLVLALAVQKNQKIYKPLGEICVELKFLSKLHLKRILSKHQKRIQLGELLINLGLINQEQVEKALERQKAKGGKVGEILVKMGFLTETALINALTIQTGVAKIVPDFRLIDKSLLKGLSEEFLLKYEVLPAFKADDVLTLIMRDPLDEVTIRELGIVFKCTIEPAIASSADIRRAITQYFQKTTLGTREVPEVETKDLVIGDTNFSRDGADNIVGIIDYIITNAVLERASDIHIEPKEKILAVRYRIDGILRHKTDLPIALAPGLVSRIKILCDLDIAEKRRHQDGRIEARIMDKEIDLRVSVYASGYGENVVIRILHRQSELIELDALGISPANRARFQQILDQPSGIILVTGPTGSGKTTTVYATLNYLNDGEKSIITVEDPIEYTMEGVVQGQLNPKLGMTYVDFLKAMMRQDPDVIMVGEIRDVTAAEAVVQAALTGHKVLSTFHTDDTTGALLRLMDMGIDTFLISSTVVSILAQRLVRVLCKSCRKNYEPDPRLLSSFGIRTNGPVNFEFWQPVGCSSCGDTGFKGRMAVHELLLVNDAIRNAILARLPSGQIRLIARNEAKLISMREDGFYKATKGITSLEEVLRVVFYNESDELSPRSSEEVIALCELVPTLIKEQTDSKPIPKDISAQATGASISIRDSDLVVTDGEVFRIRFDVTTIETETYQIADLFKEYQNAIEKVGKVVDSDLLEDFIDLVIYTVKRLEVSLKAEFVEFSLRVEKDNVKILLETLIPKKPLTSTFHTSRETGLRLINFLMPPSGMDRAIEAERGYMKKRGHGQKTPSLIGFLKQDGATPSEWVGRSEYGEPPSADHKPAEEQEVDGPSYPISSSLYKKLVEELELSSYLKDWEGRK